MNKRRERLFNMSKTPNMAHVMRARDGSHQMDLKLLEQWMQSMIYIKAIKQESACQKCPHLSACDFGRVYGSHVQSPDRLSLGGITDKVHDDCPTPPTVTETTVVDAYQDYLTNVSASAAEGEGVPIADNGDKHHHNMDVLSQIAEAFAKAQLAQLAELDIDEVDEPMQTFLQEQFPDSGGSQKTFSATMRGLDNFIYDPDEIKRVTAADLELFHVARNMKLALIEKGRGIFKPSPEMEKNKKNRPMENLSDVTKAAPHQLAADDDILDVNIAKRKLDVTQQVKPSDKKVLMLLLIDVSISMSARVTSKMFKCLSRAGLSVTFCSALIERARVENGIIYLLPFAGNVGLLTKGATKDELSHVQKMLRLMSFDGGGTAIGGSLLAAASHIHKAGKTTNLAKASILLLTDGQSYDLEQSAMLTSIRKELTDITLDVLQLAPSMKGDKHAGKRDQVLQKLAEDSNGVYMEFDAKATDYASLVNLVTHK